MINLTSQIILIQFSAKKNNEQKGGLWKWELQHNETLKKFSLRMFFDVAAQSSSVTKVHFHSLIDYILTTTINTQGILLQ